jgi:hypothetical protein
MNKITKFLPRSSEMFSAAARDLSTSPAVHSRQINSVAVIGSGIMGAGIAQVINAMCFK